MRWVVAWNTTVTKTGDVMIPRFLFLVLKVVFQ